MDDGITKMLKMAQEQKKLEDLLAPGALQALQYAERASVVGQWARQTEEELLYGQKHSPLAKAVEEWIAAKPLLDAPFDRVLTQYEDKISPALSEIHRAILVTRDVWDPLISGVPEHYRRFCDTDLQLFRDQLGRAGGDMSVLAEGIAQELKVRSALIEQDWISAQQPGASLSAIAQLITFAEEARTQHPYSHYVTNLVTGLLGPWNAAPFSLPQSLDVDQRIAFAEQQGFDQGLLAIPTVAFPTALYAAGVGGYIAHDFSSKASINIVMPAASAGNPKEIVSERHHSDAWLLVRRVELRLRAVLKVQMRKRFNGAEWIKHVVGPEMRQKWKDNQAKEKPPRSQDLLDYSELGELLEVIMRKDVWAHVFEPLFICQGDFEVSFRRLMFVRNPLSHARFLTRHEYLIAIMESERILLAMENADQTP